MSRRKVPVTRAVRILRARGVEFLDHPYRYATGGGTAGFAAASGVDDVHRITGGRMALFFGQGAAEDPGMLAPQRFVTFGFDDYKSHEGITIL